jgi:tRNA nucleotidyltransferase/poly(A) polymerase
VIAGAAAAVDAPFLVREVAHAAAEAGCAAYIVGGAVRDDFLGRTVKDVDVAVEAAIPQLSVLLASLDARPALSRRASHARFGTATYVTATGRRLDVAATRRESYPRPAALPVVTTGAPIAQDLLRRDFTVHAMARPLGAAGETGVLLDPLGGAADIASRTLRLLHARSLVDDPTRVFRAARYAARLEFGVAPQFASQLRAYREARALDALSGDRLRRALGEVLEEEEALRALELLASWGVLAELSPRLTPVPIGPTLARDARWTALFAPLPQGTRAALATRLNFSRALRRTVRLVGLK